MPQERSKGRRVRTPRDLWEAITGAEPVIEIEGKLGPAVVKLKAVGAVAWLIAVGAIALAGAALVLFAPAAPPGQIGAALPFAGTAIAVLGFAATALAIHLYRWGGRKVLDDLRDMYVIESQRNGQVILRRR